MFRFFKRTKNTDYNSVAFYQNGDSLGIIISSIRDVDGQLQLYSPHERGGGVGVREGRCFALAGGEGFQWNFEFYVFLMLFYAFETRFWSFFKKNYS